MKEGKIPEKIEYIKPEMKKLTVEELQELIVAYASCPNCYQGCNYICW